MRGMEWHGERFMKTRYQKPSVVVVRIQMQHLVAVSGGNPGGTGSDIPWGVKEEKLPATKDLWAEEW